jgi:hypothetical protein
METNDERPGYRTRSPSLKAPLCLTRLSGVTYDTSGPCVKETLRAWLHITPSKEGERP